MRRQPPEVAHNVRNEFVLRAEGEIVARAPQLVNPNLPTGEVELRVDSLEIVSTAPPLPFQLDEEGVNETLRRATAGWTCGARSSSGTSGCAGRWCRSSGASWRSAGFLDIQTPILFKPTPEGARDFVVPSRLQPGRFYALPQSPQILKQLLVIAGFDRYYQIAVCFRDEDLRADRVQELTQLDVELAFPDREFVLGLMEQMVQAVWRECIDVELAIPFRRMSYDDAMLRYGTDKPDLRFGLEIEDATEFTRGSQFKVFAGAEAVRFLRVPRPYSRAELERLETVAKEWGAKGLAYIVWEDGEPRSPIAKFLSEAELEAVRGEPTETVLFVADTPDVCARVLGNLRLRMGDELGLVDESAFEWTWIVDFPMFDWSEDEQRWQANHHPFTRPAPSGRSGSIRSLRRRSPRSTTSSATATSLAEARSGSTRPPSRSASSACFSCRPRSSDRSSASCSTRSRWARPRTAGSPSGSTGC